MHPDHQYCCDLSSPTKWGHSATVPPFSTRHPRWRLSSNLSGWLDPSESHPSIHILYSNGCCGTFHDFLSFFQFLKKKVLSHQKFIPLSFKPANFKSPVATPYFQRKANSWTLWWAFSHHVLWCFDIAPSFVLASLVTVSWDTHFNLGVLLFQVLILIYEIH